jgi:predicted amino acid racemase
MFLELLVRRNPRFLETVRDAHQQGTVPTNTVVIDTDAVANNARLIGSEAAKYGLTVFAMTKQIGRNPDVSRVLVSSGIQKAVAVDLECGIAAWNGGMGIGHIGHLVQVPHADHACALSLAPDYWTLFNLDRARKLNEALRAAGTVQKILLRVYQEGDMFYPGHEGGFAIEDLNDAVRQLAKFDHLEIAGVTSFPTTIFDASVKANVATPNRRTLEHARSLLVKLGIDNVEVNSPGTTSTENIAALAESGATQVEPGHGLTGTTPAHAFTDLPEIPAVLYVSEVSHLWNNMAFVFGGGLYVDPVIPGIDTFALIADNDVSSPHKWRRRRVIMPDPLSIDYYARIPLEDGETVPPGTTVIFGFRVQAFVSRANTIAFSPAAAAPVGQPHAANGGHRLLPQKDGGLK